MYLFSDVVFQQGLHYLPKYSFRSYMYTYSGKSVPIRQSNHASDVYKEHYA